ncbi:MAG: hypothetical protein CVV45_11745 [Spirochaetae bacterium HGW-Spirochaetae-10]|nr:MAG: hypothetical protein CVV45_11745 [Spirochaetae bacterium HGW-Spirochaetae-10]
MQRLDQVAAEEVLLCGGLQRGGEQDDQEEPAPLLLGREHPWLADARHRPHSPDHDEPDQHGGQHEPPPEARLHRVQPVGTEPVHEQHQSHADRDQQGEAEVNRPEEEEGGPGSDGDTGGYASVEENTGSPVFLIPGRADIPSAERAFRLTIARFTLKPVQESYRIVGAQQRSAHLAVTLKNDRPFPLLAGPVDSYRNSGFTGRGEIGYTPSGANLVVGFGVDRNVRLRREVQTYRESGLFSGKVFRTIIDLEVGNEGGEARSIQVFERIPVSELESVKVRILPETTPGYTEEVEKSGILRWNMSLASGEKRKIRLAFEVETPSDFKGEIYGR